MCWQLRCKACEVRSPTLQARRDTFLTQVLTSSGNPGDGVESGGGMTCCKNGDDSTNCEISTIEGIMVVCKDKVDGSNCGIHGFTAHCCPESDVGIAWFLGGCH